MGANLDPFARAEIDSDDTQKPAAIPTIVFERYVDFTNQCLIARDAGEQTVFDVGLKLVGNDDVFARQRDTHNLMQANGAPKALRRELRISFIFRQRVTVLM